jgi:hypothetical protein
MFLSLALTEHLDYNIAVKIVGQCAGRALGLLIAKYKSFDGLPYEVYTISCVVPVSHICFISVGYLILFLCQCRSSQINEVLSWYW